MKDLGTAATNNKLSSAPYQFTRTNFVGIASAANGKNVGQFAIKFDNTVFTNLVKFAGISATYQNIDKLKFKLSQQNSGATLEGTNFIVKYMGEHPTEFNGGNYAFEAYDNAWARYVDVEDRRSNSERTYIYYEFKSVEESNFKPAEFIDQFVKDLQKANSLSQIKWIFDYDKMSSDVVKTRVMAALKGNKELLNSVKIIGNFNAYAATVNYNKEIENVNDIITFIDVNNDWFNLIFK